MWYDVVIFWWREDLHLADPFWPAVLWGFTLGNFRERNRAQPTAEGLLQRMAVASLGAQLKWFLTWEKPKNFRVWVFLKLGSLDNWSPSYYLLYRVFGFSRTIHSPSSEGRVRFHKSSQGRSTRHQEQVDNNTTTQIILPFIPCFFPSFGESLYEKVWLRQAVPDHAAATGWLNVEGRGQLFLFRVFASQKKRPAKGNVFILFLYVVLRSWNFLRNFHHFSSPKTWTNSFSPNLRSFKKTCWLPCTKSVSCRAPSRMRPPIAGNRWSPCAAVAIQQVLLMEVVELEPLNLMNGFKIYWQSAWVGILGKSFFFWFGWLFYKMPNEKSRREVSTSLSKRGANAAKMSRDGCFPGINDGTKSGSTRVVVWPERSNCDPWDQQRIVGIHSAGHLSFTTRINDDEPQFSKSSKIRRF